MATNNSVISHKNKEVGDITWEEDDEEEENSKLSLCLTSKVWTTRKFNAHAFMPHMECIWNPKHGLESKDVGQNGFLFQFFHWRDKEKDIKGEPWTFDKDVVVLKELEGEIIPSIMGCLLASVSFWAQAYDLPFKVEENPT